MSAQEVKVFPCGKTVMDIVECPKCLEHFSECAAKSRTKFHENVMTYMEVCHEVAKHKAEEKTRRQQRAKCRSLAKRILKKKQDIESMRRELSKLFYEDVGNRPFTHMERTCDPKNDQIREALRD